MSSLSRILHVAGILCRVAAIALSALVVALCFSGFSSRALLLGVTNVITSLLPSVISGILVFVTPFDGAFRGDFALVAVMLFVLDWVLQRVSSALR